MPMKWRRSLPLALNREVPSGMTPLPWVARILPQRFVLPDLQNLHSPHSGVLHGKETILARGSEGYGMVGSNTRVLRHCRRA